ncbi:TetR family transcriptional regulator [Sphingomonas sp. H39-1-10]|uniref:TetR/AcrR family transcriptional regulator n=1 Tax=Sphingomonas TaxID=13687 RepID=UPI00210EBE7F|nr:MULTISPECIES: TetR family transcriptional regulator [Sphingomonas]MDF0486597.1 TetR family transcriptional regulator [Sphingomonas pollutisoli]
MRDRIVDAVIDLLAEGGTDISHDRVAERTAISRRTVYRYFPDRESLMQSANEAVRTRAGPRVAFPESEADLTEALHAIHTGFDAIAPLATVVRSTPQGRAMRLSQRALRVEKYRAAAADAVRELPAEDRLLATAMLQALHTTLWLEMRDQWGLDGAQIARATGWAMRTLLADLKARGARPLDVIAEPNES